MSKVLFVGLNDFMLRNLLHSGFAARARELGLELHGLVYEGCYPAYRDLITRELDMQTAPQQLTPLKEWKNRRAERLAFRAQLFRAGRVDSFTYRAFRRQQWVDTGGGLAQRIKLETAFVAGRLGGQLGLEDHFSAAYHRELERTPYVQDVCVPRLEQLDPDVLISASPETFYDVPWLIAAGLVGIPRVVWIRSWDNVTSKMSDLVETEVVLIWAKLMGQELASYYPRRRHEVIPIGTLQFDRHHDPANLIPRADFCRRMELDPERPIVLYCTGGPHIVPKEQLLVRDAQRCLESMPARPQLLVRLHPYFWNTDMRAYDFLSGVSIWPRREDAPKMIGGSTTGLTDDFRTMVSSFHHQAVNLSVGSTVMLDSAVMDRPIISLDYDPEPPSSTHSSGRRVHRYDHYRPIVATGAVALARSPMELRRELEDALAFPGRRSEQRRALVELECGTVDGGAGARLADAVARVASGAVASLSPGRARRDRAPGETSAEAVAHRRRTC